MNAGTKLIGLLYGWVNSLRVQGPARVHAGRHEAEELPEAEDPNRKESPMNEPLTQAQDHDRRIGRLEGIAEQSVEQDRQTNTRLDSIERSISEVRKEIAALTRWLVGMQIATLLALGTLILSRLP